MIIQHASDIKSSNRKGYACSKEDAAVKKMLQMLVFLSLFLFKPKKSSHFTKKQSPS